MTKTSSQPQRSVSTYPLGRKTLGRYELLRPLASGGMATVFLGRLSGMAGFEKLVAIKVIHPHLAEEKAFVGMFLDEARLSAKIHHPNVIEIFEVAEEDGLLFMVAELVQGKSLDDIFRALQKTGKRLEQKLFLTIIAKVCDALTVAHTLSSPDGSSLNLVHRDITPSNILVSYDGFVKLIDFGIAYARERITQTKEGVVKGKFGYMAPEQLQGKPVNVRNDIFSVGVVLYLLATGKHPFPGNTHAERVNRVLNVSPKPPREISPQIDPALEQTILKALAKDPEHRHQTAKDLGLELRELLAPLGGFMDDMDIADLMSELFHQEIIEHKQMIEQAVAIRSSSDFDSEKNDSAKQKISEPGENPSREDRVGANRPPPKGSKDSVATILFNYLSAESRAGWKRLPLVLIGCAAAVYGLSFVLNFQLVEQHAFDWWKRVTTSTTFSEVVKETHTGKPPDENVHSTVASKEEPGDAPSGGEQPVSSVRIRLLGLPDSAEVLINGQGKMVMEGEIVVAADGVQKLLEVIAKGYIPYRQTIAPTTDSELFVNLKKKKPAKRNNVRSPPETPGIMECPWCEK